VKLAFKAVIYCSRLQQGQKWCSQIFGSPQFVFSHDEQRCVLFRQRGDCSGVTEPLVCAGAVTLLSVDYVFIHTQTELCAPASTLTHTQTRSWFSTARM